MRGRERTNRGFTIVELLIVIVVIAILASITIVAYNGIQKRAQDSNRLADARTILTALEQYRLFYGTYPEEQGSSWEQSNVYPTTFLQTLATSTDMSKIPVDPVNNTSYHYRYYLYPPGTNGCPTANGSFFVLQLQKPASERAPPPQSPGFQCGTRVWDSEAWYTVGKFVSP